MDDLPNEVLDMIFQYVSTPMLVGECVRVCRRWQLVVERRALALREPGDERRLGPATRRLLVIATVPIDRFGLMDNLTTKVRFIREITMHCLTPLYDPHVQALRLLPNLAHLDVFTSPRVLDERLSDIVRRLTTLVANEKLAPGLLRDLARSSRLMALHMYGRAMCFPHYEMLELLRARASHLHDLTLRCADLPDAAYGTIGACYNLRSLRLYWCWQLSAEGARALCRPRLLRRLHVTGARLVRRQALAAMLELLPEGLTELALSDGWFGNKHVPIVAKSAPELRVLELWRCKLTAAGAEKLARALPNLEMLDLDLTLPRRVLRSMARHPALQLVRCRPDNTGRDPDPIWEVDGLRLFAINAQYALKYFHICMKGFRSSLFYYWTQDVSVEPLLPFSYSDIDSLGDYVHGSLCLEGICNNRIPCDPCCSV